MDYEEWVASVPGEIKADSLWKMKAYRFALYLGDLGWQDTAKLARQSRLRGLSDQLYRALGSISANVAEGYSRGTGRDRARFYEYALGSARESRDWYFKARHTLGEPLFRHRLQLLTGVIKLLLTMIPQQRGGKIRELPEAYQVSQELLASIDHLLENVPLPDDA